MRTPVAAWYAMGRLDEPGAFPDPDHAVRPPSLPLALEWVLALGAWAAVVGGVAVLARSGRLRRSWRSLLPGVLIGVWLAFVGRVATAAVVGANIGFGLLVMVTPVAVGVLAVVAARNRSA